MNKLIRGILCLGVLVSSFGVNYSSAAKVKKLTCPVSKLKKNTPDRRKRAISRIFRRRKPKTINLENSNNTQKENNDNHSYEYDGMNIE